MGTRSVIGPLTVPTLLALTSCSLILDPQLPDDTTTLAKFGEACDAGEDCETGLCRTSRCTETCTTSCPTGSTCTSNVCEFDGPPPLDELRVGFLYVGPVGDHGWTLTHDESRRYVDETLPYVSTRFAPSVTTADADAVIEEFIRQGDNVIVGTSFDFLVPMLSKASNYPDVRFLLCSGFQTGPNLGSYFARMEQPIYMAGFLAGKVTKTNRVGLVGSVVIPETVRHINAFTRGLRDANPEARAVVRWVYAWFNPPEETAATQELVAEGVDVIFGQTDTTIPLEVSKTMTTTNTGSRETDGLPVYSIGYDNKDSCDRFAPERCLTSAYWNWGPMLRDILEDIHEGTWKPRVPVYDQMKSDPSESTVYLSEIDTTLVPTEDRLPVEMLISAMTAPTPEAKYYPFRPPLYDNTGTLRVATGQLPTDEDLLDMCWYVDGVYDVGGTVGVVPAACVGTR
ncbi:BMP family ABC transporter substrate-binding protein [Myxococcota bacterium]|nr:BMP family ABC transporter substrate-binding protein [Myxococcota bacterium]